MTNELPGRRIIIFVAAGPKNYCYLHTKPDGTDPKLVLKIRGFQLHYRARIALTLRRVLRMVMNRYGPKW